LLAVLAAGCGDSSGGSPDASTKSDASSDTGTDRNPCNKSGVICTYMGNGEAGLGRDGVAPLEVSLYLPQDLTLAEDGTPFVLDWNNHRVRTLRDNKVKTIIGTGELGDAPDGPALDASLNHPTHIAIDPEDRLIMSAWHNSKVMRYDPVTKDIEALCGTGARDYGGDGGPAKDAILDLPVATAFDSRGRMLIMDQANQRIRRIEDNGTIQTVVGPDASYRPVPAGYERVCADEDDETTCRLCLPDEDADMDAGSDPFAGSDASADAGVGCSPAKPQGFAGDGRPGTEAVMYQPFSQSAPPAGRMEMGPDDTLYFCDTGNQRVRVYDKDGKVRTVAGSGPDEYDPDFAGGYDGDGGPATEALLKRPTDVAVAPDGTFYIADTFNSCIRRVDTDGIIDTVAGQCGTNGYRGDEGPANEGLLNRPYGIALDKDGNLFIADTHNHRIRVVHAPL
jgi:sugar lactone lactonase YvrE